MRPITPFLWFDDNAEEAAGFYRSVFERSRTTAMSRYGKAGPGPEGSIMVITLEIAGQELMLLNGGPQYHFTEAVSLMVQCDDQAEIDRLWEKLTAGGEEGPCGWLKDRFGVSWQVVPAEMPALLSDSDPERARRVTEAMFQMKKIDIAELEHAYQPVG